MLLAKDGIEVNKAESTGGQTPLIIAAAHGHSNVVKVLLEAGADSSVKSRWGTALEGAIEEGQTQIVKMLTEHMANSQT